MNQDQKSQQNNQENNLLSEQPETPQNDNEDRISLLGSPLLWIPLVILAFVVMINW